jgi:hypothetical protein
MKVEYENRARSRWCLANPALPGGEVIMGSSADRTVQGERDPVYQPDPVITITGEQDKKWPAGEAAALKALVAKGDVQRRELA